MAWRSSQALLQRESSSKIWARAPLLSRGVTTCNSPPTTTQDTSDVLLQTKNGEAIFAGLSTKELVRTLFNLHLVAYEPMVDLSLKVLTSPMMRYALFQVPVNQVVKRTAYSHFCAGENVEEASRTLQRMWELGLRGILDYSSEDATDNKSCDKNLEKFIQVVQQTNQLPQGSVSTVQWYPLKIIYEATCFLLSHFSSIWIKLAYCTKWGSLEFNLSAVRLCCSLFALSCQVNRVLHLRSSCMHWIKEFLVLTLFFCLSAGKYLMREDFSHLPNPTSRAS